MAKIFTLEVFDPVVERPDQELQKIAHACHAAAQAVATAGGKRTGDIIEAGTVIATWTYTPASP